MLATPALEVPARWERLALSSGVAFAVVQLAAVVFALAVVVPTHAPVGAPPAETAAALARHAPLIAVGTYLLTVPLPFLLLFLGGLGSVLRRAEGDSGTLAGAAGAAGTATIAVPALFPLVALQLYLFPLWILGLAWALLSQPGRGP